MHSAQLITKSLPIKLDPDLSTEKNKWNHLISLFCGSTSGIHPLGTLTFLFLLRMCMHNMPWPDDLSSHNYHKIMFVLTIVRAMIFLQYYSNSRTCSV